MSVEEQFRVALHERLAPVLADVVPSAYMLDGLRRREVRRHRFLVASTAGVVAAVATVATGIAWSAPWQRGTPSEPQPTAGLHHVTAPAAPLITSGACAGLRVVAWTATGPSAIAPIPSTNTITLPVGGQVSFVATGPCAATVSDKPAGTGPSSAWSSGQPTSGDIAITNATVLQMGSQTVQVMVPDCAGLPASCLGGVSAPRATITLTAVHASPATDQPPTTGNRTAATAPTSGAGAPLVSKGACAGLMLTAEVQTANAPTWRILPTSSNNITAPPGALIYLQAHGPCVDALRMVTAGGVLQGGDPSPVNTFNDQAVAIVVTHNPPRVATQLVAVWLSCPDSGGCDGTAEELAVIPVTVTASKNTPASNTSRSPAGGDNSPAGQSTNPDA